ncbi:MAG: hypothetical protein ACOYXC_07190 [Candidatus Rifleibacteriota bacterium]
MKIARILLFMVMNIPLFLCAADGLHHKPDFSIVMPVKELAEMVATGTPPREENEYKLVMNGDQQLLDNNSYLLAKCRGRLEKSFFNDLLWKSPGFFSSSYRVMETGLGTFCFMDIYLDTEDGLNFKNNISYRIRYRWHSRGALFRHMLGSDNQSDFPHRCEYQLKIYDQQWEDSFNSCSETRFEFRNDSFPFKSDASAPPAPWRLDSFIPPAITGRYGGFNVITTVELAEKIRKIAPEITSLRMKPALVVITTRRRIHLGLPNEFGRIAAELGMGSIVNADQVFLLSLDRSEVYSPDFIDLYFDSRVAIAHNSYSKRLKRRLKNSFKPVVCFYEMEFEFERNIESALNKALKESFDEERKSYLQQIRAAFLKDLETFQKLISETLAETGLEISPGRESKYRQSYKKVYGLTN